MRLKYSRNFKISLNATDLFHKAGYVKRSCHWIMQQKHATRHNLRRRNKILNNAFHTCRAVHKCRPPYLLPVHQCICGREEQSPLEIKSNVSVSISARRLYFPSLLKRISNWYKFWRTQFKGWLWWAINANRIVAYLVGARYYAAIVRVFRAGIFQPWIPNFPGAQRQHFDCPAQTRYLK